jgi:hypothetical protein
MLYLKSPKFYVLQINQSNYNDYNFTYSTPLKNEVS